LIGNKRIGQHEYNIRLLTGKDEPDVQDLCERCSDFFELTEGRPPGKDAGNLILDPNVRGSGLGRRLHDFIKDWVLEEHGRALRIGVVEENHRGHKFWCKMGYIEVDRVKMTYGNKEQTVKVMNLFLK